MFNDDIQGTAAVALGGVLAALKLTNSKLEDNRFLFVGAGQAACGIAELISLAMSRIANIPIEEAYKRIFMYDIDGLVVEGRPEGQLDGPKSIFVKSNLKPTRDLVNAIEQIRPTCLIGASGSPKIFTAESLQKMAEFNQTPIIFALSNPTSRAECTGKRI